MHLSSTAAGWIAVGAAAVAVVSLVLLAMNRRSLERVRSSQNVLLGGGTGDLVDFAVSLQARIDELNRAVHAVSGGLERIDARVDGTVSKTAIVRYDAYENSGGHQSASVAMLDASRSGVVLSAIQDRVGALSRDRASAQAGLQARELLEELEQEMQNLRGISEEIAMLQWRLRRSLHERQSNLSVLRAHTGNGAS